MRSARFTDSSSSTAAMTLHTSPQCESKARNLTILKGKECKCGHRLPIRLSGSLLRAGVRTLIPPLLRSTRATGHQDTGGDKHSAVESVKRSAQELMAVTDISLAAISDRKFSHSRTSSSV